MIAAIVFDLDGVLIDSEPVWEWVRRELVAERGGHWAPDAQRKLMGMSTPEWARYLSEDLGVGLPPDQVAALVIDRMAASYREHLPLLPGAVEAVHRLAARWPLGLASSAPAALIATKFLGYARGDFSPVMPQTSCSKGSGSGWRMSTSCHNRKKAGS
jgi:beta-phosphoglucomutase-like phosphatase (HAD superfamily)